MKHYGYDEWLCYVTDELDEGIREELENHLYTCDQCLELYMQALEANETSLPTLTDGDNFTARVMEMVPDTQSTVSTVETSTLVPDTQSTVSTVETSTLVPDTQSTVSTVETSTLVPDTQSTVSTVETSALLPDSDTNVITLPTQERPKRRLYQQAGFHYVLAAAATLLLTFTGAFQSLAGYAKTFASPPTQQMQEKQPSVTEGVIDKTFAWMDSLEKKEAKKK